MATSASPAWVAQHQSASGRRGVGDGRQLTQRVGAAQLMLGVEVGVIGRPGVVHRDPAEPAQDPGVVDAVAAAFGVAGDQGVLAGAGAVHPVQLARPRAARSRRTRPPRRRRCGRRPGSRNPSSPSAARAVMRRHGAIARPGCRTARPAPGRCASSTGTARHTGRGRSR